MIEKLTLHRAVEFAIKTEELGAKFYDRLAAKHADSAELKELFSVLARDEEIHEYQFKQLLNRLPAEGKAELSEEDASYLRAIATAEIFYGGHDALAAVDRFETRQDALQQAANIERATLQYYHGMQKVLGPSETLDDIIAAERQHFTQVMKYMMTGAKVRSLLDEF